MDAPLPPDEDDRLRVLQSYQILDTMPEDSYDDLVALASHICGTPISTVTLVDRDRQWFKARVGTDDEQNPRDVSFCAHAILQPDEMLIVEDATKDARFASNNLVLSEPRIRFYAGAPLVSPSGAALGTLCVIDRVPRQLEAGQILALRALARQTMALLDARRVALTLADSLAALGKAKPRGDAVSREAMRHVMGDLLQLGGLQTSTLQVVGRRLAQGTPGATLQNCLDVYAELGLGDIAIMESFGQRHVFEARNLLERQPGARAPTCYLALGFLSGIVAREHDMSAPGTEVACQSKGAPACRFVVQAKRIETTAALPPR